MSNQSDSKQAPLFKSERGWLHSVETGAAVDGPGVRFALFLSGCLLRCQYCHNPDTWKLKGGTAVTLQEVLDKITPYRNFLKRAGGVTISGGEPLVQAPFALSVARACQEMGLHVALDTQGYMGNRLSDADLDAFDLYLLDIKHIRPDAYKKLTAVELQPTLDFAKRLASLKKKVWLRYVLVPNLTDAPEDIEELAIFSKALGNIERVNVLPFHQLGRHKWEELGQEYPLAECPTPTSESVQMAKDIFLKHGLVVH